MPVENGEQVIGSLPSVDEFSARVTALLAVDVAVADQLHIRADMIRAEADRAVDPSYRLGMRMAAAMVEDTR